MFVFSPSKKSNYNTFLVCLFKYAPTHPQYRAVNKKTHDNQSGFFLSSINKKSDTHNVFHFTFFFDYLPDQNDCVLIGADYYFSFVFENHKSYNEGKTQQTHKSRIGLHRKWYYEIRIFFYHSLTDIYFGNILWKSEWLYWTTIFNSER